MPRKDTIKSATDQIMDAVRDMPNEQKAVRFAINRAQQFVEQMAKEDQSDFEMVMKRLQGIKLDDAVHPIQSLSAAMGLRAACDGAICGTSCAAGCLGGCIITGGATIAFGAAGGTIGGGGTSIATSDFTAALPPRL